MSLMGLTLTEEMALRVGAGAPLLPISSIKGAEKVDAGRPVRLLNPVGQVAGYGVVVKLRPKGGVKAGGLKQEILGETPPQALLVKESGVPFEVHLLGGINVGLFTDMREHRRNMGRFVAGRRVLNTFAYTGALSV